MYTLVKRYGRTCIGPFYLVLESNGGSQFYPRAMSDMWPNSAGLVVFSSGDRLLFETQLSKLLLKIPLQIGIYRTTMNNLFKLHMWIIYFKLTYYQPDR